MARINVEDSILTDERFLNLVIKLGSVKLALGEVVWAWRQGQRHFLSLDNDRCIPFDEWTKQGCNDLLINVGLAERRDKGVWIVGAKEQFSWLIQKQSAGEKSGEARREKKSKKANERPLTGDQRSSTNANGAEPLSSFLSTLSSNLNLSPQSSLLLQVVERIFTDVYPRKIGLKGAQKILVETPATKLNTVGDCHDLLGAVSNYINYIADPQNEVQNVYGFKGFAEVWRKWIPQQDMKAGA